MQIVQKIPNFHPHVSSPARFGSIRNARLSVARPADLDLPNIQLGGAGKMPPAFCQPRRAGRLGDEDLPRELPLACVSAAASPCRGTHITGVSYGSWDLFGGEASNYTYLF